MQNVLSGILGVRKTEKGSDCDGGFGTVGNDAGRGSPWEEWQEPNGCGS